MRFLTVLFVFLVFAACKGGKVEEKADISVKKGNLVFSDDFNRDELGRSYTVQGGDWKIEDGEVVSVTAKNRNLVLSGIELPQNGIVELTMWSESEGVDVKFNLWGDGKIHDHGDGYSFILGGWSNRVSVISKLHEHEKKRSEEKKTRLQKGERYKVKVVRNGSKIKWFVNDKLFLDYSDEDPLKVEKGFKRLSFGNWKSEVHFDDLRIYELNGE